MKGIQIDFVNNTIIITKKFYTEAMEYGTEEYKALKEIQAENPQMKITIKQANRANRRNAYKGLTYRYMRKFISTMDPASLNTFDEVQLYYEGLYSDSLSVYNGVREWFIDNYPDHKEMIVESVPQRPALKIVQ